MNESLRARLRAMAAADDRLCASLARDGTLFDGYNPRMAELHDRSAAELASVIGEFGWPGCGMAGRVGWIAPGAGHEMRGKSDG